MKRNGEVSVKKKEMNQLKEASDSELVDLVQNNNPSAFGALAFRYSDRIQGTASRFVRASLVERDDFFQEGMLALYRAALTFRTDRKTTFATYASHCINNAMVDLTRKEQARGTARETSLDVLGEELTHVHRVPGGMGRSLEEQIMYQQQREEFLGQFKTLLSPNEYRVLLLYLVGFSYKEIGEQTGSTEKSVDNALQRVKQKLRPYNPFGGS